MLDDLFISIGCLIGFAATVAIGHCAASAVCLALWFSIEIAPLDN